MHRWRHVVKEKSDKWPRGFYLAFPDLVVEAYSAVPEAASQLISRDMYAKLADDPDSHYIRSVEATVKEHITVGGTDSPYRKLRFRAPALTHILPGQFVMIDTAPSSDDHVETPATSWQRIRTHFQLLPTPFLKRPFGIHRAFYPNFKPDYLRHLQLPPSLAIALHTARPHQFDILYKVLEHGIGTQQLQSLRRNDKFRLVGPLGRRIHLRELRPMGMTDIHVIGGGVGMAPLVFLVQALRYYAFRVKAFIGIESTDLLRHTDSLASGYVARPDDVHVYIDDLVAAGLGPGDIFVSSDKPPTISNHTGVPNGNIFHGRVVEQYRSYIAGQPRKQHVAVFACGPIPMMKQVVDICSEFGLPVDVLLEKRMACGTGVCLSCVCKIRQGGETVYQRVCTEGPLFKGGEVEWTEL
jgi:dihydroorotate dehydrogenase electron transfer subunit